MTKSNQPHHGELWEAIREHCPNPAFQERPDLWQLRFPVNTRMVPLTDALGEALWNVNETAND